MTGGPLANFRYTQPPADGPDAKFLVAMPELPGSAQFLFHGRLEIGRDDAGRVAEPGLLLVADPIVSRRHCVLSQDASGRCFVRDVSRNGTCLDGQRLVPDVETPIQPGQVLTAGSLRFVLRCPR